MVGTALRGDEILSTAIHVFPDVITVDVSMPGQSGLKALPPLRSAFPAAIIVVVSTTMTRLYVEEAFIRGADDYIEKTNAGSDLMNAILSAQDRRDHNQADQRH